MVSGSFLTEPGRYLQVLAVGLGGSTLGAGRGAASLEKISWARQKNGGIRTYWLVAAVVAILGAVEAVDGRLHLDFVSSLKGPEGKEANSQRKSLRSRPKEARRFCDGILKEEEGMQSILTLMVGGIGGEKDQKERGGKKYLCPGASA